MLDTIIVVSMDVSYKEMRLSELSVPDGLCPVYTFMNIDGSLSAWHLSFIYPIGI
jgi:hypothetical protein